MNLMVKHCNYLYIHITFNYFLLQISKKVKSNGGGD